MIPQKFLLFFLCMSFYQELLAQDGKLSWYYPTLGEVNPRSGKKGLYTINSHGVSGCVSGNCKSGEGEYLKAATTFDANLGFMEIDPTVSLTMFKGQFSNDGKDFEGKVYTRKVAYDVVYKKDDPRLVPKVKENLKDENFWKSFEVATGTMRHDGFDYKWNGWMETAVPAGVAVAAGQVISTKTYFKQGAVYIKIQYAPGGPHTEIEGRTLPGGDLICGRLRYPDGSMYEGFLHTGDRFGPGRYSGKDGKPEEGIWMLDSLAVAMPVSLPKEIFEPISENVPTLGKMSFGGYTWSQVKDAGGGWVYAFYPDDIFFGKAEGGNLNGPGIWFSKQPTPNSDAGKSWDTYRTGIFKNGNLSTGIRVRDVVEIKSANTGAATPTEYTRNYTTAISGEFEDDQLKPSCAKMTKYNDKGTPVYQVEGYFTPGYFKTETADGWAYINDWEGKREAANLQYMHNNQNYLAMEGTKGYVSWFTRGFEALPTATYCFAPMKGQSVAILPMMKHRHDSVVALVAKKEADIVANKKEYEKRESEYAKEASKYDYRVGDLYQLGEGAHPVRILITGPYEFYTKSFPVTMQSWFQSTKNTGYLRTVSTNLPVEKLKLYRKLYGPLSVCPVCEGRATMPATVYSDVGGNSGHTSIGGGWAVKNPETHWKSEIMVACKSCAGIGFIRK
ncbi:MAG: hypothetical protein V4722_11365 [Bacteroidota bacterium]